MTYYVSAVLCVSFSILFLLQGCVPSAKESLNPFSADDVKLAEYFDGLYYQEPQDSPARYALNQIASRFSWRSLNILRGKWSANQSEIDESRKYLQNLKKQIEMGQAWPLKAPPSFEIPYTKNKPIIDGILEEQEWQQALTLHGEYLLDSTEQTNDSSLWLISYDNDCLYIGISFHDEQRVQINYEPGKTGPWQGDSLETFILPSKSLKDYRETVLGCEGELFTSLHVNDKWGTFINGDDPNDNAGIRAKTKVTDHGYTAEVAIPFSSLPNYMLSNKPEPGQTIYFAFVRTDRDHSQNDVAYRSAFPLLYSSHNIFGYASGLLLR